MERRRALLSGGLLPSGYEEVKCIQFSNHQYFDCGFVPTVGGELKLGFMVVGNITGCIFSATNNDLSSYQLTIVHNANSGIFYCKYFTNGGATGLMWNYYKKQDFVIYSNGKIERTVEGTTTTYNSEISKTKGSVTGNLFIGKRSDNLYCNGKLYYFSYGDNINLIPCLRKSDSKPGFYDTVTKTFFTNQGTGEFGYEKLDGTIINPI